MKSHVEIESKYDVGPGVALPDLIGAGGVRAVVEQAEMVLTATYYDTAGAALAGVGATLRRRTGGADDGWHLKLPLADGERLEVHRALGRSLTPPTALTSLVRASVRADPLVAVARLVNRRTVHQLLDGAGTVLAELADDSVTGQRLDTEAPAVVWREVEIELVEGDRDVLVALDSAVRAAGLQPGAGSSKVGRVLSSGAQPAVSRAGEVPARRKDPVGRVLDGALAGALAGVIAADPLLRVDRPGSAAGLRAALGEVRAALALRRQLRASDDHLAVRAELGWLDSVVADLESTEAVGARLRSALAGEPSELVLGPVARRLDRQVAAVRRDARAGVVAALDSPRYLALLDTIVDLLRSAPLADAVTARAGDVLPDLGARALRRAERRVVQVARAQSPHELGWAPVGARRSVARARLALTLASGQDPASEASLGLLAAVDEALRGLEAGRQAQQVLLSAASKSAQVAGENVFTLGRLHGREDLAAHLLRQKLAGLRKKLTRLRSE